VSCQNFKKIITSIGYLTARENEVELLTTKFYSLYIIGVEKFHEKSVCNKIEGVQLKFFNTSKPYNRIDLYTWHKSPPNWRTCLLRYVKRLKIVSEYIGV